MNHSEFKIGETFYLGNTLWLYTDVGTRTINAIIANEKHSGPPFDVCEVVFDEYDLPVCRKNENQSSE